MHESLDEFKFWPDTTTDSGVICPRASENLMYNAVNTLAPLFLVESSFIIFAYNKENYKVRTEYEILPDRIMHCGVSCP